jgi:hypothetical protein
MASTAPPAAAGDGGAPNAGDLENNAEEEDLVKNTNLVTKIQDYGKWQQDFRESQARFDFLAEGLHTTTEVKKNV